jgi:hypothetical protein
MLYQHEPVEPSGAAAAFVFVLAIFAVGVMVGWICL